jgi:peptidyl-dipeptidase A
MKRLDTARRLGVAIVLPLSLFAAACQSSAAPPDAGDAEEFLAAAEARLLDVWVRSSRADWVQANFITHDTEILAAQAKERQIEAAVDLAKESTRFAGLELDAESERKLELLRRSLTLPAPSDQQRRAELTRIAAGLESTYGSGRYCPESGECLELEELETIIETSRDPLELLEVWRGWRTISVPMRPEYRRLVELANGGAVELGFRDLGDLWRSKYDMPAEEFSAEVDRLWEQVRPLYEALHCHVRAALAETYGSDVVDTTAPIPAHLLGNMWAQTWSNVYPLVAPPKTNPGYDLTELLREQEVDEIEMVRYGERFFTSLGFEPLPETFWERSLFTKPRDRNVVCHASAWDLDYVDDLRIKMCIEISAEDFSTIHHELGHNFYQRAYAHLDPLYRDSANDGFHEAVGDVLALSVTPDYLVELGFLDEAPPPEADLGLLLRQALDKVAFLPFGLLVDQWRWRVFSGDVPAEEYNGAWWELRRRYQGIEPPIERSEADFDPGAKYHVPASVPYTRYFLAHILQFQIHRDLCAAGGFEGPLHRCTIYGSREAGERLQKMMAMGQSRPWPEALAVIAGEGTMDASAIGDYFAPLQTWLEEQNEGRTCGW